MSSGQVITLHFLCCPLDPHVKSTGAWTYIISTGQYTSRNINTSCWIQVLSNLEKQNQNSIQLGHPVACQGTRLQIETCKFQLSRELSYAKHAHRKQQNQRWSFSPLQYSTMQKKHVGSFCRKEPQIVVKNYSSSKSCGGWFFWPSGLTVLESPPSSSVSSSAHSPPYRSSPSSSSRIRWWWWWWCRMQILLVGQSKVREANPSVVVDLRTGTPHLPPSRTGQSFHASKFGGCLNNSRTLWCNMVPLNDPAIGKVVPVSKLLISSIVQVKLQEVIQGSNALHGSSV